MALWLSSLSWDNLPRMPKAFFGASAANRQTASNACFEASTSSDLAKASELGETLCLVHVIPRFQVQPWPPTRSKVLESKT
eukprot:1275133-Amphidinium_carterae.2